MRDDQDIWEPPWNSANLWKQMQFGPNEKGEKTF